MIQDDIIPVILGKDAAAVGKPDRRDDGPGQLCRSGRYFLLRDLSGGYCSLGSPVPGGRTAPVADDRRSTQGGKLLLRRHRSGLHPGRASVQPQAQLEAGHRAVKIKVGRKNLEEDLQRVRAVRKMIGPERDFMIDANASWDIPTVLKAAPELQRQNIYWLEEPLNPRHFDGYRELNRRCALSVAMGENLHSENQHRLAMQYGRIAYPTPDASNVGGITGWLRVAALAKCFHLPVCTHGMQELHVSLLAAMPHAGYMEIHSFFIDQYTQVPGKGGKRHRPGTGFPGHRR